MRFEHESKGMDTKIEIKKKLKCVIKFEIFTPNLIDMYWQPAISNLMP